MGSRGGAAERRHRSEMSARFRVAERKAEQETRPWTAAKRSDGGAMDGPFRSRPWMAGVGKLRSSRRSKRSTAESVGLDGRSRSRAKRRPWMAEKTGKPWMAPTLSRGRQQVPSSFAGRLAALPTRTASDASFPSLPGRSFSHQRMFVCSRACCRLWPAGLRTVSFAGATRTSDNWLRGDTERLFISVH